MFVDINTYIGHWPFRNLKYNTLEGLDSLAQKYDITHMVVANVQGLFYKDADVANEELLEQLKTYSGKTTFLPLSIVDPQYPNWEKYARKRIDQGFAGFEIAPLYHGYEMAPQLVYDNYIPQQIALPVMKLAKELDVPVRICAGFENIRGRGRLDVFKNLTGDDYYALLKEVPEVHVLCTNFRAANAGEKLAALLKRRPNTYFDVTQGESQIWGIPEQDAQMTLPGQLCHGSFSPFDYMEHSLLNMEYAKAYDVCAMKTNGARAFRALR